MLAKVGIPISARRPRPSGVVCRVDFSSKLLLGVRRFDRLSDLAEHAGNFRAAKGARTKKRRDFRQHGRGMRCTPTPHRCPIDIGYGLGEA
jgi:hypothetical protein